MRLSPHFRLSEFTETWRPEVALNVELAQTGPYLSQMMRLCEDILEPMRAAFHDAPVRITSGFRYAELQPDGWHGLDVAIRLGRDWSQEQIAMYRLDYDPRSQHTRGEAADLHVAGATEREVWEWLWHESPHPFGQIILEHGDRTTWVHVSIPGRRIAKLGGRPIYGEVLDWTPQDGYTTIATVDRWDGRGRP
jgi:hypothetical protein